MSLSRTNENTAAADLSSVVSGCEINSEDADTIALDVDMMSVLQNRDLKGDLKWFQYYKSLERYLYKRDPTFEPLQFTFEVQSDSNGIPVVIIKAGKKKQSGFIKFLKYFPPVAGPAFGVLLNILLR